MNREENTDMKLKPYLVAPILFVLCLLALLATWAAMEPADLRGLFDADGEVREQDREDAEERPEVEDSSARPSPASPSWPSSRRWTCI